jgi:hypothetical protein
LPPGEAAEPVPSPKNKNKKDGGIRESKRENVSSRVSIGRTEERKGGREIRDACTRGLFAC